MNRKNMDMLAGRLRQLGFSEDIQYRLLSNVCFAPAHFEIDHQMLVGADRCRFSVHCVRGDQGLYDAIYFIASLSKLPETPTDLSVIDSSMHKIDWQALYQGKEGLVMGDPVQDTYVIADLLQEVINIDKEGLVRYKHWSGTSLEEMVPNLSYLKTQFEISQRFYLIDQQSPINFGDAMRFLQSRWLERKVNSDRKLLLKSSSGRQGGHLLKKRLRNNRRLNNNNS
ncbi:MAG: hypothetical protein ACN4EP_07960 [Sediminibacterium sp.]